MLKPNPLPFYLKLSQITMGIVAFTYVMYIGQEIILPLLFALLIAILLNPFVEFLQRKGLNRIFSILISILLAFIIIVFLLYFLVAQASIFAESLPQLREKFSGMYETLIKWFSQSFNISIKKIHDWISSQKSEGLSNSSAIIGKTLITISGLLFTVFLLPVYTFLFLFYKNLLIQFISFLFPKEKHNMVKEVLNEAKKLIQKYLYGLSIEAGLVAILNSTVLLIIGIDYAILIGVIGALLNVIPYIGGIIAIALPIIIAVSTGSTMSVLWIFIAYMVVQFIDNQYIVPYIVASKVKLNGLISIIVVLVGGALWGVAGMFLAIPLTAILKVIFDHIEPMKPWGILLGEETVENNKSSIFKKKKPTKQ